MSELSEKELARLARGRRAMDVLSHEVVTDALEFLTDQATAEWRGSASASYEAREEAYRQVAALDALRAQLGAWAEDAQGLAAKQDRLLAKAEKPRRFGVV